MDGSGWSRQPSGRGPRSVRGLRVAFACVAGFCAAAAAPAQALTFGPAPGSPPTVGASPAAIVAADLNGDGIPDLAVANGNDGTVSVLLANGSGGFRNGGTVTVGSAANAIAAGDFDGNGTTDLAVANYLDDTVSVLLGDGHGAFTSAVGSPVPVSGRPTALATGSFGPGPGDIAVLAGGVIQVIGSVASGPYAVQSTTVPDVPHAQALTTGYFDFTNSSFPDLAVLDGNDGAVFVLLSDGQGNFTVAPGSPVSARGSGTGFGLSITTGDFGVGSHSGVAVGFDTGQVSVLLGDGQGGLSLAPGSPVQATTDQAISLAAGSFGAGGAQGVAVSGYFQGGCVDPCVTPTDQVAVLTNDGTGRLSQAGGSPYALFGVTDGVAVDPFVSGAANDGVAAIDFASCHGDVVQPLYAGAATPPTSEYPGDGCPIPTADPTTDAATNVSLSGATLNGNIDPHHQALTDCHFEYGIGTYDHRVACAFSGQYADTTVHSTVTGLTAKSPYQFRLVASTAGGTSYGGKQMFDTCDSTEVKKGPVDATGCFLSGRHGTWIGSGNVRVNGIDFDPGSSGGVSIDPNAPSLTLTGHGKVVLGGVVTVWAWSGRTTFNLGGTINLVPNVSGKLYGLPLTGALTAKLSEGDETSGGEATLTGTVTLTALGDPVTAALSVVTSDADGIAGGSFRVMPANADNNYFELSPCSRSKPPPFGFSCEQVESASGHAYTGLIAKEPGVVKLLGFLPVEGLSGTFDRSTKLWSLTAAIALRDALPGGSFITRKVPTLTIGATFRGFPPGLVGGQLGDSDVAIDVGVAVFDDFSFHAQFYPRISFGGDASLRAGPGKQAVQISAGADAEQGQKSGWDLKAHGTFSLQNEISVGGTVEYDGRDGSNAVSISGTVTKSYGPISLTAALGGGIGNSHYQVNANGNLTAFGLADLGASGIVSDAGFGLCATAHALIFSGDVGFKHFWGGDTDFNGCDFGGLYTVGAPAGTASVAARGRAITLRRGLLREEIGVVGASAAPNVTLTGPGGVTLSTPVTPDRFEPFGHAGYALAVTSSKTTWFVLTKPRAGRWIVSALAGSPAIARIERADPLAPPAIHAAVTGTGAHRILTWRVARQHGVTVRFVQAGGTEPTVATSATHARGRVRFKVAPGKPGIRRVVAVLLIDGFPRSQQTVARFRMARQAPRVTRARYRLRRRALTVRWRRAPQAVRYELDVRLASGLLRWFVSGRSTLTTVKLPAGRLRGVTLIATDASGRPGPPVHVR